MDPIFLILNHKFEEEKLKLNADNVDSFFANQIDFPQLVSIAFKQKITDIIKPSKDDQKKITDNEIALKFLIDHSEEIKKLNPKYDDELNKTKLIALILTKQIYKINSQEIIDKCNYIINPKIKYKYKKDIIKQELILSLLHILTNNKVQLDYPDSDFDQLISKIFKDANAPLVINQASLSPKYYFTFLIQIKILFEKFEKEINEIIKHNVELTKQDEENDTEDFQKLAKQSIRLNDSTLSYYKSSLRSEQSKPTPTGSKNYPKSEKEEMFDEKLLKTINIIGKKFNISFENLYQTVHTDSSIEFIKELTGTSGKDICTFEDVINSLNEPKFRTMILDFQKPKFVDSSIRIFYTTLLNVYFLKKSKKDLFKMAKIIVEKPKIDDEREILFDWGTYMKLNENTKTKVENIIDVNYLNFLKKENVNEIPDVIYYHLQMIYNEDEAKYEKILNNNEDSNEKVKLSPYEENEMKQVDFNESFIKSAREKRKKSIEGFIEINKDDSSRKDDDNNNEEEDIGPESFFIRMLQHTHRRLRKFAKKGDPSSDNLNSEQFWDQQDPNYTFKDGILYDHSNNYGHDFKDDWDNSPKTDFSKDSVELNFNCHSKIEKKGQLYKIYEYNENLNQWEFNVESTSNFVKDKCIEPNFPIVLFSDSYEKDIIDIATNFVETKYPVLDDDNIFVYSLCDKSMNDLSYTRMTFASNTNNIKPIFLLLHVPKSKESLPNIKQIVIQIMSYLSFICDCEIVVLNKEHYIDQIEMTKNILEMKTCFIDDATNKTFESSVSKCIAGTSNNDYDSEGYEEEEDQNEQSKINFIIGYNYDDFNINKLRPSKSNPKYIFLLNDTKAIDKKLINNLLTGAFDQYTSQFPINTEEPLTYREFLRHFSNVARGDKNNSNLFNLTTNFINFHKMTTKYISLRGEKWKIVYKNYRWCFEQVIGKGNWENEFKKLVNKRFEMIKKDLDTGSSSSNSLVPLKYLQKEFIAMSPALDLRINIIFYELYNEIKKEELKHYQNMIKKELKISSISNLDYLEGLIEKEPFWSNEDKNDMINNHLNYLKSEFFSIIHACYQHEPHLISSAYRENSKILNDKISEDVVKINEMFAKNINNKKDNDNEFNKSRYRTDYSIRENQNTRELQVEIGKGKNLKDYIPQDF